MTQNTLKSPFVISIIFHTMVILSIPILYQPARQALLDITPIEVLKVQEEKPLAQIIEEPKKEEPKKVAKTLPHVPKQEEKKQEIKNEQVQEQPKTVQNSELPALPAPLVSKTESSANTGSSTIVASTNTETKPETGSKYGLEGGTGKGSGDEMSLFKTMVRTKIERAKFYPRWARQRGFEGVVGVKFTIQPDGSVNDVKVAKPCHCDVLNKAACEAIMKAAPFNPKPNELGNKEIAMEIDISFKLE
ncbi:MAG: energy transducer TonB [Deltaproteobacteria bacterium]|nr:energy transducer TonB [Deltaproteobacteria bacterium]